jgi:hypothetical protein
MDSLKFQPVPPLPTLLRPVGGPVFYRFGHPTPYAYASNDGGKLGLDKDKN